MKTRMILLVDKNNNVQPTTELIKYKPILDILQGDLNNMHIIDDWVYDELFIHNQPVDNVMVYSLYSERPGYRSVEEALDDMIWTSFRLNRSILEMSNEKDKLETANRISELENVNIISNDIIYNNTHIRYIDEYVVHRLDEDKPSGVIFDHKYFIKKPSNNKSEFYVRPSTKRWPCTLSPSRMILLEQARRNNENNSSY